VRAIREKDLVTLQVVPRMGRKKAEQLVLDLADKLDDVQIDVGAGGPRPAGAAADDAIRALVSLGYTTVDAERAVKATIDAGGAAIQGDINQYAVTWGAPVLRIAIAEKYHRWYQMDVDPDRDVTVTCGATEAMASVFLALIDPGDEVVVFEPFYENYGPDTVLAGAKPVFVPLVAPDWRIDEERLTAALARRPKAIVLNTPHNPSGKVFTREEIDL